MGCDGIFKDMNNTKENFIQKFFAQESAGGITLVVAALLAIVVANSPLSAYYALLIDTPVAVQIGSFEIAKPLLLWINDGLMAVFFLLVGLELKRECVEGELSNRKKIMLPAIGAVGGMLFPALIYVWVNKDNASALSGWAVPAATDIAFALGVLSLLGKRVPLVLKVFLTSLAIFDDIGAIIIIAFFYTSKISFVSLAVAFASIALLYIFNKKGYSQKSLYFTVGLVMWVALLKSGVHATLAGVILALFIPMTSKGKPQFSPLKTLEHDLHVAVAFIILPIFAFANAGIDLRGGGIEQVTHGVPLGIALGLFFGNQIGIFLTCFLGVKLKLAQLPEGMTWKTLYGVAILCGIGFTMSLFVGSLAFENTAENRVFDERLGIIIGSLASGILGYFYLNKTLPKLKVD